MSQLAIGITPWKESVRHHYSSVLDELSVHHTVAVSDASAERSDSECLFDLILSHSEHSPQSALVIRKAVTCGVPTLSIMDGILEWRNSWERPQKEFDGQRYPMHQPVMAHKLACIGRSQARVVESWGNLGKCEVVGVPRFDRLLGRSPRHRETGEPFRVLIMTAKNPGFSAEQTDVTRQSLVDLKTWFESHPRLGDMDVTTLWRVNPALADGLGVQNTLRDLTGTDLADVLRQIDAVITTPSTAMLEAMLQGLPVVLLDYHNRPHYVPAAWTISSADQISPIVQNLVAAPPDRMLYQMTVLHDALECRTPATPRMVRLVLEMIRVGRECRATDHPLQYARRILSDEQDGHHLPEETFDLRRLYPAHPEFASVNAAELQVELGHARAELRRTKSALDQVRRAPAKVGLRHRLATAPVLGAMWRLGRRLVRSGSALQP